jgi:Tol biopolymer transport system component
MFGKNEYCILLLISLILPFFQASVQADFVAQGVRITPLTNDGKSTAASWAYHGDLVAFIHREANSEGQLKIMNSNGSNIETVTPIGNPFFVEWSWRGDRFVYEFSNEDSPESQGGVFIYDMTTKKTLSVSAPHPRSAIDEVPYEGPNWSSDDKYVVYKVRYGPSRTRQLWVAETRSGKLHQLVPNRGQAREHSWSPFVPSRLAIHVKASGNGYDIATIGPDSRNFINLTNIGAQSVQTSSPRWSPTGQWVAFNSGIDMTQTERDTGRKDVWIARPDGSEARNLTNASSPATERQISFRSLHWSWDGRWILADARRYDNQGSPIPAFYLVDPINGGYEVILTSDPQQTSIHDTYMRIKWSYDSSKIAFVNLRHTVRNWGATPQFEKPLWILSIYDVREKRVDDVLIYDEQLDSKKIVADFRKEKIEDISWSPNGRSILLTIGDIISRDDDIFRPDVYRLDLPERFIGTSASQHIGPPFGRETVAAVQPSEPVPPDTQSLQVPERVQVDENGFVTETVEPVHMTTEEAISSLSAEYGQYLTENPTRNILLFKGPPEILASLKRDLKLIDTQAPHILVDFLAVELSDEANRNLGLDWTYTEGHFGFFQPSGRPIQQFGNVGTDPDFRKGFPSGALDTLYTLPGVGQSFYQGVGTLPREFFIRLNTLVQDGDGTILANPRTVAMSGKESLINIRKTLNYFFNEGFDVSGRPIVKKSDISADTEGRITPVLLPDGKIHLVVDVKVGTFTFTQDAGLPELTTRQSTTEVTVTEGETLVLGGLRQQETINTVTKVPLLGDIPMLGFLFRREEKRVNHSVLTIFITPQVLRADNLTPQWPQINKEDHQLVPIMPQ